MGTRHKKGTARAKSECGELERSLWYTGLIGAWRSVLEVCGKDHQLMLNGVETSHENNVPPSLMTGFARALRAAASSSSRAIS